MLKKLITMAGLAGTLGMAAPAFADWYQPAPAPVYGMPVQQPGYGYGYGYGYGDRDDWRRHEMWRRREEWRRWHRWEWERHHHYGYYQNW
jgi:hypothetical protein